MTANRPKALNMIIMFFICTLFGTIALWILDFTGLFKNVLLSDFYSLTIRHPVTSQVVRLDKGLVEVRCAGKFQVIDFLGKILGFSSFS